MDPELDLLSRVENRGVLEQRQTKEARRRRRWGKETVYC